MEQKLNPLSDTMLAQGMEAASKQSMELRGGNKFHEVQQVTLSQSGTSGKPCYRCSKPGHLPENCFFKKKACRNCGKQGHIAKVCRQKQDDHSKSTKGQKKTKHRTHFVTTMESGTTEESREWGMFAVNSVPESGIKVDLKVNGVTLNMILDTGASLTIISKKTWRELFPNLKLEKSEMLLKTYSGEKLRVLGQAHVPVEYKTQKVELPLLVVGGMGPALLGRNWLEAIQLDWKEIQLLTSGLDSLLTRYSAVFREELGTMTDFKAKLAVNPDAVPKFCRARPVPYALKEAIEKDLERLEKLEVIEHVNHSEWATPVVPVQKPDGSVRLCGDYKVTVNPVMDIDKYPIPKPEDLLTALAGGKKFSKIDLSQAYQQ